MTEFLTAQDVADRTTLDVSTLTRWRKRGEGPRWVRLGRRRVAYPERDFTEWLAAQEAAGGERR